MPLVTARIQDIPFAHDRHEAEVAYERMWQGDLPGFITPPEAVRAPAKLTHIKLVERSAAWLSRRIPNVAVEAQLQDTWPDEEGCPVEDIGPHVDGLGMNPGDIMWRTSTYTKGRAAVFLANMNPDFLTLLRAQGLNEFQMEEPIQQALISVQEQIAFGAKIDADICGPDFYYGQLSPGYSLTFRVGYDSCAHDFVTVGEDSREFYEASARFFAPTAVTIGAHELLEGTQPAVQAWPSHAI